MLEFTSVGATTSGSTDVRLYDELAHSFRGSAVGNIEEHVMEIFELIGPPSVRNDPPVLPQHSEIELLIHARDRNEGRLTRGGW